MFRTKHLFIAGVLLVGMMTTGLFSMLLVRVSAVTTAIMPAAVVLSTPEDHYPVIVDAYDVDTRAEFIERIRNEYVPPPEAPDPEPEVIAIYTPQPTPVPTPLPVAILEQSINGDVETTATTSIDFSTATTAPSDTIGTGEATSSIKSASSTDTDATD